MPEWLSASLSPLGGDLGDIAAIDLLLLRSRGMRGQGLRVILAALLYLVDSYEFARLRVRRLTTIPEYGFSKATLRGCK
jgi:hypothetical protein